jgi:Ca-activated chloride channel family protein
MSFIWPYMLFTLLLVPLFVWLYLRLLQQRQQAAAALGPLSIAQSSTGSAPGRRRHIPPTMFLLGLTLLLFGLSRPEMVVSLPRIEGTVILAFDVSNSMIAEDLAPTRMDAAKEAARTFVENQPNTIQIGVVAFSNGGLIIQPPTNNQADVLAAIDRLSPQGGTSLGQGIFSSLSAIAGEPITIDEATLEDGPLPEDVDALQIEAFSSAVIVMLSDGEDTGNVDPMEIANLAAESGVRIYPIGIGSNEGTVIQVEGFNILTQLNEPILQNIASLTNGEYFYAEDEAALQEIYENVDLQLTIDGEKSEITSLVAGISALFLLIGGILSMVWFGRVP